MKIQILAASAVLMVSNLFAQTFTNYTTADGLLHDNVNCLDVDASNTVWFGTQNGVSVFDGVVWSSHTVLTDTALADNTIQAIYVANSGDVWAGTDFGASVYNGAFWTKYTTADGLGNNQIKCISEDLSGNTWFGTNNGASMFDGATWTNYGTAEGLPFGGVVSLTTHSNGDIWMGTGLGGVMVFDGATFSGITIADGLIDDRIRAIVFDGLDNRWIGTSEGISVFDNANIFNTNHTTMFSLPGSDTLNPVEDIEMDSQGNIWVGVYVDYLVTEGGVCAYAGNQWFEYHVADGLVGPVIRALAIDGNDDVWVATSTGVSKLHDPTVGMFAQSEENSFALYPNPATEIVTVKIDDYQLKEIELYNSSMQLVKKYAVNSNQVSISLSVGDLSSGMYFVKMGGITKKLILN